jgi:type II secretory pathway pseudopilin PulG
MVAIAIMGILASLLLGAAAVASEAARNARTKSLIARLHTLVMERYDGYRTQRVELRPDWAGNATPVLTGINFVPMVDPYRESAARLVGLREVMRLEMPDRWSDIVFAAPNAGTTIPTSRVGYFLQKTPALYSTYARAYNRVTTSTNTLTGQPNTTAEILENESAECLYLVIMNATGDGEAPGMFKTTDIGDTDGDGAPEFLDGWGKPIQWLRWAPGFDSDAQLSVASLIRTERKDGTAGVAQAILDDHDPFDLFRLDTSTLTSFTAGGEYVGARGWRLVPLVTSGGGDEEIGIRFDGEFPGVGIATLDPYDDVMPAGGTQSLGEAIDADLAADDITNHNVGELSRK